MHRQVRFAPIVLSCLAVGFLVVQARSYACLAGDTPRAIPDLLADRTAIDAGDVFIGQNVRFEFRLTNRRSIPLHIDAHPNCGCTVADFASTIRAGGTSAVTAQLSTLGMRPGRIAKTITVRAEEAPDTALVLSIQANIRSVVEYLQPDHRPLVLGDDQPASRSFQLRIAGTGDVELSGVSCNAEFAHAALEPVLPADGSNRRYLVHVTVDAAAPRGRTPLTVLVATTAEAEKIFALPLTLEKGILAYPGAVILKGDPANPGQIPTAAVTLVRRDGTFRITKVDSFDFQLDSQVETVREGQEYRILLASRGLRRSSGRTKLGVVRIETDDPRQPAIELKAQIVPRPPVSVGR